MIMQKERILKDHVKKGSRMLKKAKKCAEPFPSDIPQLQENIRKNGPRISNTNPGLVPKQSENNSIGFGSRVVEGSEVSNDSESSYSHDHLLDGMHCR
ncbi:unnamed protein product [Ilex paraguariensis]|uniref:Uncharacterized protein n=1 Tax=Ilex paraguariensis TaxID=185542 RepID=A0ABC8UK18_9AQUA